MENLILVGLSALFWTLGHSFFITHFWRDLLRRQFPRHAGLFRSLYVLVNTLSLGLLMIWWRGMPTRLLWDWPGPWSLLRYGGLLAALVLFWLGLRAYDGRAFLGLRQIGDHLTGRPAAPSAFRTTGILHHIRHPWYSGTFLVLIFGLPLTDLNLVWRSVFLFYTIIGTELEERKLLRDMPNEYAPYRARVPRFWPRWPRFSRGDLKK